MSNSGSTAVQTTLVLLVPEAEPFVADYRQVHDPSGRDGMPAHITLVVPFVPRELFDGEAKHRLGEILARQPEIRVRLRDCKRFPGTLWLAPEDPAPIIRLTKAVVAAFPAYPPYGGAFAEIIPHLTVAQADEAVLDRIENVLAGVLKLRSIEAVVTHCSVYGNYTGRWLSHQHFALAAA